MYDAEHGEVSLNSPRIVVSPLSCPIVSELQIVYISPDSLTHKIYRKAKTKEQFNCSYGFNETYHKNLIEKDLKIVGVDEKGNARIVELSDHRFFIGTLFLPQSLSSADKPHPLIVEYLNVAKTFQGIKQDLVLNFSDQRK